MIKLLVATGLVFAFLHVWSTIMIYAFLKSKSRHIESFLWIKMYTFYYVSQYKSITTKEKGRPGYLFYIWIVSINLALLCFLPALLMMVSNY